MGGGGGGGEGSREGMRSDSWWNSIRCNVKAVKYSPFTVRGTLAERK